MPARPNMTPLADAGISAPVIAPERAAQPPPGVSAPVAAADRAQQALRQAIAAQYQWRSLSARMRTEVHLFDQRLVGSGTYIQGPAQQGSWRLELRIKTDNSVASLIQVCDGRQFWNYRQLSDRRNLEWVDAARVSAALARLGTDRPAGGPPMPVVPTAGLGVGGGPRLLRSLDAGFDFRTVNEGRLERMPVWILAGTWKAEMLAEMLPEQRAAIEEGRPADLRKLAAHIPDRVTLFLGRDDLFPYRLEYHRDRPGEKEWESTVNPQHSQPVVTLEWFEVRFDVPLARDQFYYNPGDTKYDDVTGRCLLSLGLPLD
jgi:hypothetical protein